MCQTPNGQRVVDTFTWGAAQKHGRTTEPAALEAKARLDGKSTARATAKRPGANIEKNLVGGGTVLGGSPAPASSTETTPAFGKTLLGQ